MQVQLKVICVKVVCIQSPVMHNIFLKKRAWYIKVTAMILAKDMQGQVEMK